MRFAQTAAVALAVGAGSFAVGATGTDADAVDFNRDIRPILSDKCYHCHGQDPATREAGLRLDQAAAAHEFALVPGKPGDSEALARMVETDPNLRMPPPDSNKRLSPAEIELIRRWVREGAGYAGHWSFASPEPPEPPAGTGAEWGRNPIDAFILRRLRQAGLEPSPPADKTTLIRRVTLDLTGLPPTPEEVDVFLSDESPDAYEKVVDRLLASPRFGERMAVPWLDAARYADTMGYQADWAREHWRWRSWVIDAYNRNLPFDQFTIEQLAGDLLPDPSTEQLIATGFNRNHRINDEQGIVPQEFLTEYIIDRVDTTAATWMGLTMGCARCHDHKYDPISQKDFYQFYAYFNAVPEKGKEGRKGFATPYLRVAVRGKQGEYEAIQAEAAAADRGVKEVAKDDPEARAAAEQKSKEAKVALAAFEKDHTTVVMVMQEMDRPRDTFVLNRGVYDQPGAKVGRAVPAELLGPLPEQAPNNRLGLARWLVSGRHPLTARVAVNRYWAMLFGTGIVATLEDFGLQGEYPSHPELLDWLATEYPRLGWDTKAMLRLMVTSATYRQSSRMTPELLEADPDNRLLARSPRLRLPAEAIRDQALFASGLLVERIGGPSVKPYQPAKLWSELSFADKKRSTDFYVQDTGEKLFRRSLYTFWKRTVPPPTMEIFDAPARETCVLTRSRTNTPLQALALMNDVTFVEACRVLAEREWAAATQADTEQPAAEAISAVFRRLTAREPTGAEHAKLLAGYKRRLALYEAKPEAAEQLTSQGSIARAEDLPVPEVAALTTVAMTVLNLDETVTRE